MRRKLPTGTVAPPAGANAVSLVVEYEDAADFLADYEENLSRGEGLVQAARLVDVDTPVQLGLTFPGLVQPILAAGIVRAHGSDDDATWMCVDLSSSAEYLATLAQRVRDGDRRVVVPVFRLLIAEDNVHISQLVKNGLTAAMRRETRDVAFCCDTAIDGAAALELLKTKHFDAVIVDVYLPVLDGSALIRQMRGALGLASLPVIGLSGGGEAARRAALGAGATAYLDKPIQLRHILETLRKVTAA